MRELPVGRRLCRSPSTGWRTGRRWVALRRQRLRCGIGRDTGRWLRYGQRRSPDGGSSGGGTGSGGSGGGGNSPDAGSGGGTAISAEQLTSGEKAQVLALDDQNVYWASYENAGGWRNWHYRIFAQSKSGSVPFPIGPIWQLDVDTSLGQIAVDDNRVYYRARWVPGPGGLWTVRLDGLDNEQLTTDVAGTGPVLDSGALYYFDTGGDPDVGFWSALRTIPASGGNVTDVRRETNTMIWPGPLSLGAGSVFTVTQSGFWRAPLDGPKWQVT